MPYRRLPNTDKARLRAIRNAIDTADRQSINNIPFDVSLLAQLQSFYPIFETATLNQKQAIKEQNLNSKKYGKAVDNARLYLHHFIQVYNFAVIRKEIKAETRTLYGLDPLNTKLPTLTNDKELLFWGEKYIQGEQQRITQRGNPIYSPSIAVVKVKYDLFKDLYFSHNTFKKSTIRHSKEVLKLRNEADRYILKLWNEIEGYYSRLAAERKRERASEYGVVYVYRPYERAKKDSEKQQCKLNILDPNLMVEA
ncbi:hypothetical protein K5X82_12790 [Halosquirtibacter xylanolyticus]|uniref:hypothetical protein n=1 Tax=Halosquirtibacter xylanolyticus TaxID=3374599 RepID=UPI0037493BF1|nr:hypothetical protein K5X82_12790 [Prolixibacteraceae bacterium]